MNKDYNQQAQIDELEQIIKDLRTVRTHAEGNDWVAADNAVVFLEKLLGLLQRRYHRGRPGARAQGE